MIIDNGELEETKYSYIGLIEEFFVACLQITVG